MQLVLVALRQISQRFGAWHKLIRPRVPIPLRGMTVGRGDDPRPGSASTLSGALATGAMGVQPSGPPHSPEYGRIVGPPYLAAPLGEPKKGSGRRPLLRLWRESNVPYDSCYIL
jgi:hypothetical protein